jgi:outer membrane protein TolC
MMLRSICLLLAALTLILLPGAVFAAEALRLTLAEAVQQAMANNLGLQMQMNEVEAARGLSEAAQGEFDVLLKGEGSAGRKESARYIQDGVEKEETAGVSLGVQKKFITGTEVGLTWKNGRYQSTPASPLIDPAYSSGLSLEVRQPLLQGFGSERQTATLRVAEKNQAAATELVGFEAANLAAKVKAAYWNLVYAWQEKHVKELSLTLARKLYNETEEQIRAGKLAEVDIYQPQSEIARREEGLISADRTIGLYEDELRLLINSHGWNGDLVPTDLPPTLAQRPDVKVVEEKALANRPDLKAAELAVQAAAIEAESAEDKVRPSLALVGSVGQGGTDSGYGDSLSDAVDHPETEWQAGLVFSLPLENSTAKGLLRKAQATRGKAGNNLQQLRLEVQKSVRTTVRDVQLAIKAMEATKKTALATRKRLEAEEAKFAVGRATTFDVLTAQEAYAQALSLEKQSQVGYALVLAELDRIQGQIGEGLSL